MMNQTKLTKMAKTWQKIASLKRKRISLPRISNNKNEGCNTSGKFVIYTNDHKRFSIPIAYISNNVMKQLFEMSEEAFGLPSDGPIRLPCDSAFLEYVVSLIKRGLTRDMEKALLVSMEPSCCSFYVGFNQGHTGQQRTVYAY